ncbi:hypothetical protein MIND_00258100 [Mycena indigotica]|uniref:Uncharacterized protein n=1 Tax=Mycena indigotica TaxID=2126181 RepID=A0A8H6T924_9AGAR|nr:uncharacterized protein MIND_00258100 [Mycena indigotica]KAF7312446.1 hypothetical protein MIND_00258100 [Mycena indigotica]
MAGKKRSIHAASASSTQAAPAAKRIRYDHTIPTPTPTAGPSTSASLSSPTVPVQASRSPRKKATTASAKPTVEKRLARFKSSCPQNIGERVGRVMSQRFFMVDRERVGEELKEEFKVLGSTGNIYTVTVAHLPSCDCPDASKGNHCKHILFVFLKVLQVPQSSQSWYQKALLTTELEEIFANAPVAPNSVTNPRIREAYAKAVGKTVPEQASASQTKKRMPAEDDDCPICYDEMHSVAETSLVFCESCGNAVHKECFGQWQNTSRNQGKPLTCIYCRASWPSAGAASGSGGNRGRAGMSDGYVNLAGVAGVSPQRDTSSYYDGPRRGRGYYGYRGRYNPYDYD